MGLFNLDWDDLLAYNTVKVVKIRDARLGILHLSFMVGIILYIVVFQIFLQKGYLEIETPLGSIRTSLMAPSVYPSDLHYCTNQGGYNSTYAMDCQYWDENLVVFPVGEQSSFTATTRVRTYNQVTIGCSFTDPTCRYTNLNETNLYLAGVENFTLMIDHTMYAPISQIQKNAVDLSGYIRNQDGDDVTLDDGLNFIGIEGVPDIITIGTFLQMANIDLDGQSLVNASNSIRYDGVIVMVFITYSNTFSQNLNSFKYSYYIQPIEESEFTVIEPIFGSDITSRYIFKRHGLRILFFQTGTIGKFEFQSLLLTFVSGMGLLAVSTIVVDQLAIRILPQRKSYSSFKFQVTEGMQPMKKIITNDKGDDVMYSNIENL
ncbi:P2X receptor [Tieghemostelium lacteum]|uniref:P2X receptor n=1 Tax=Tieghemostelium lacteum TaxID=361077 RepID=A0A152A618_TIELA|nr:P2X receptor [Tieghemostelium lacteum]|eukprot:KYR01672.1 P2X receptor [Tieghemostelium lacteum]